MIRWITTQMSRAIEAKKEMLCKKKLGAVLGNEPKIIWLNMINRVNRRNYILSLRNKYNLAIEDILANKDQHYLMDITAELADHGYFDQFNKLNEHGKAQFWREVDNLIELFEKKKISLKPMLSSEAVEEEARKKSHPGQDEFTDPAGFTSKKHTDHIKPDKFAEERLAWSSTQSHQIKFKPSYKHYYS